MKLINTGNNLELIIDDEIFNELKEIGLKHFPNEFGGFLLGYYSSDFKTVFIKRFLLPKRYKGMPVLFERYVDGMTKDFEYIFQKEQYYYVGEWHTHPNGSTMFSQTDLNAMNEIIECETVQIQNPILLILSINEKELKDFTFYFYNNAKLIPYE